jgi:hypothetical protein
VLADSRVHDRLDDNGRVNPRRELLDTGFPDDDGAADADVRQRLAEAGAGQGARVAALGALARARLLVPVVVVLGEVAYDEQGLAHDKSSDMAAVLLTGRDGRQALLAFTGMDSMAAWRADARPVPVTAQVAAASAVQEGAGALLVDVAGPAPYAVEGDDLQAFARGWVLARVGDEHVWVEPAS